MSGDALNDLALLIKSVVRQYSSRNEVAVYGDEESERGQRHFRQMAAWGALF